MNRKKNEEYRENQITTILTFDFTIYIKKYTLLENTVSKSSLGDHSFAVFMRCKIFETQ